jgi:long-subunit fatty acid transport protein
LFLGPAAYADLSSPNVVPLGETEAFMGNTGVAVSNSSGGVYYNPASLAAFGSGRLTGSGQTFAIVEASVNQQDTEPLKFKEFSAVPSMLVAARKWRKWTGAFSILMPAVLEINTLFDLNVPSINLNATASVYNRTEEAYMGLSAGRRLTRSWDWGWGVHFVRSKIVKNESLQGTPYGSGTVYISSTKRQESEVHSLVFMSGVQKQIRRDMRFGLNVHSESLKLRGRASVYEEKLIVIGGTPSKELVRAQYGANAKLPWQILTGFEWEPGARHTMTLDAGISLPTSNHSLPNSPYNEVVTTRTTVRYGLGYSYQMSSYWQALMGVNFNPSTVDSVESREVMAKNNYIGFSAGAYNQDKNVTSGVGLFYLKSRTDKNFFAGDPSDPTSLTIYGLMLTSSISY